MPDPGHLPVQLLVEGTLSSRLPQRCLQAPFAVPRSVRICHVPAGLDKHGLVGVERDSVICTMATGMHLVIALPVALIPPIHVVLQRATWWGSYHARTYKAHRVLYSVLGALGRSRSDTLHAV